MHDPAAPDHPVRGREIALLTNPTSGHGRGARHRDAALRRLRESGFIVRNLQGRDADEASDLARGCVADGVEALSCAVATDSCTSACRRWPAAAYLSA